MKTLSLVAALLALGLSGCSPRSLNGNWSGSYKDIQEKTPYDNTDGSLNLSLTQENGRLSGRFVCKEGTAGGGRFITSHTMWGSVEGVANGQQVTLTLHVSDKAKKIYGYSDYTFSGSRGKANVLVGNLTRELRRQQPEPGRTLALTLTGDATAPEEGFSEPTPAAQPSAWSKSETARFKRETLTLLAEARGISSARPNNPGMKELAKSYTKRLFSWEETLQGLPGGPEPISSDLLEFLGYALEFGRDMQRYQRENIPFAKVDEEWSTQLTKELDALGARVESL